MNDREESPEEVQVRLQRERRMRGIADTVKPLLAEDEGFILLTANFTDAPDGRFSSTQYLSTLNREDAARLMTELLDRWVMDGNAPQPSVQTMTLVREQVAELESFTRERLEQERKQATAALLQASDKAEAMAHRLRIIATHFAWLRLDLVQEVQARVNRGAS